MFKKAMEGINHGLLWPAMIVLIIITAICVIIPEQTVSTLNLVKDVSLTYLGGTASLVALICVVTIFAVYISPLGKVRFGGKDAVPMMNKSNWFFILICTTIATGCVYWGIVQPIVHIDAPPLMWGCDPHSPQAIVMTMSTIFLQWTLTPYAIYMLPAMMFAFVYFNMGQPYGILSTMTPILGEDRVRRWFTPVSCVLLVVSVLAVGASLAQGMFNLSGAAQYLFGIPTTSMLLLGIACLFVIPAVISSISGILKGIKVLSDINFRLYIILMIFFIFTCNLPVVLNLGIEGLGQYFHTFFKESLGTGVISGDSFYPDWINYNFAVWMSAILVAPVFMGALSRGRTMRELIEVGFFGSVIFGFIWMTIVSGTAISQDIATGGALTHAMNNIGWNVLPYKLFDTLPLTSIATGLYLIAILISFITYTDSTLTALSKWSSTHAGDEGDQVQENPITSIFIKIMLGASMILVTWIMVSQASIDGARILANLSGWVCMIIEILLIAGFFKIMKNPDKYNYIDNGRPEPEVKKKKKISLADILIPGRTN